MGTETQQNEEVTLGGFGDNDMFDTEKFIDQQEEEDELDLQGFDGVEPKQIQTQSKEQDENEEDENEEDDIFNFEGATEEEKIDLEDFNKKFKKDFKSEEELRAFMNGKEKEEEKITDEQVLEIANSQLELLTPVLDLGPEQLMRKQYETVALNSGKSLDDEEVQIEIEEKIQNLIDSRTLYDEYKALKDQIVEIVNKSKDDIKTITTKKEEEIQNKIKVDKEEIQKNLIEFYNTDNFYGVKLDKKIVASAYQKINTGKFIENLQTDKKAMAELALMAEIKEIIFKKSSGLTYNDGIAAVLKDFKSKPKADQIAKAQSRGTAASAVSQDGLISAILTDTIKENK